MMKVIGITCAEKMRINNSRERHLFIHDSTFSKLVGSCIECVYVVSSNIFLCRYLTNIE